MTKIYTVRHAESIANTEGIYQGQTYDTNLSGLGKKQAVALANALAGREIEKIVSSPLKRTLQTAQAVSDRLSVPIELEDDVIETDHGIWESQDKQWIALNYPNILNDWNNAPMQTVFPGGESFLQTVNRIKDYLVRTTWKENTLIVTHDNIVRIITALASRMDMNDIWDINTDPAGISEFVVMGLNGEKRLKTVKINETEHLNDLRSDLGVHAL